MSKKSFILIVDDIEMNRNVLNDIVISLGYFPILAENGLSALGVVRKSPPDLILCDIRMPEMDGYELLKIIKADSNFRHIPVIMISAVDEMESVVRCIELGADDYMVKPFNAVLLKARINASLQKKKLHDQEDFYRQQIEEYNRNLENRVRVEVKKATAAQMGTIFSLSKLAESRDPETGEHLERMREYCRLLSTNLSRCGKFELIVDSLFIENIYIASPLHDVGKVGIPDSILLKPGKLSAEEFEIMKTHAIIGGHTLELVDKEFPGNEFIKMGIMIARSHHEKWNGTGYPDGLSGREIPLVARIVALGDVYDALTSKRCYKEAFHHDFAVSIISKGRGEQFDPDLVDAFLELGSEFLRVSKTIVEKPSES